MLAQDTRLVRTHQNAVDSPLRGVAPIPAAPFTIEKDLRDYFSILLKRKWLILSVVLIVTSVVALYVFSLPSMYESSATLQLASKEYTFMQDSKGTILRSYDNYDYQNTQIGLLSNPQLMRQVVLKLDLDHNASFVGEPERADLFSRIRKALALKKGVSQQSASLPTVVEGENNANELSQARIAQLEPYVSALLANLRVEPRERTSLVTVSIRHTNPEIARQVVDALTKIFIVNNNDYETKGSQAAAETLGRQVADLQSKITQLEDERLSYLKSHNLPLEKGDGRNLTAERLGTLSSQLLAAENERKNFEATYESAKSVPNPLSIPAVRDSEEIQEMRKSIHQLEQKRASLIQVYTSEWPEVKKIDAEIKQLREDIGKSAKETVSSLKSKLDAAVAREAKLHIAYYAERGAANNQTQDEISLANLTQQIETSRGLYTMLFQRLKEMDVNSLDKSNRVGIVTPPVLSAQPVGPARLSAVLIAFLISIAAGLGLAVLVEQFDNTLRSAEDVVTHTGMPTLALIPARPNGHFLLGQWRFLKARGEEFTALALTKDLRSPTAEAYRHLRASLLFASTGQSPRSILVTSGRPYEGKTTTAINAAITFAQTGAEVLIIDCDFRRPQLHRQFGLSNSDGLTSYLSGQKDLDSLLRTHENYPNLKLITAGPIPANPAVFLGSNEMRELLAFFERRFAHVIIDSPPASSFADASILSTMVDGVIIVVKSGRGSRRMVRRVKDRLQELGACIYGVVLNHADLEADDYYSGYYANYD